MSGSVWWRVLVAGALLAACGGPERGAPPLEPEDYSPLGVPIDADSGEIRLSFGDPDSAVVSANPYDAFSPILTWYYPHFLVTFEGGPVPASYLLTGPAESTLRGVRVGDPSARVLELYGAPTYRYDPVWTYADAVEDADGQVVEFLVEDDVVTRIHLGRGIR
jgi:hypothetical protein